MVYNPDELEEMDKLAEELPVDDGPKAGPVPPGTYQAKIERAAIRMNDFTGHDELNLYCRIIHGKQANRVVFPSASFDPDPNKFLGGRRPVEFLIRMLRNLGMSPPPKPSEVYHDEETRAGMIGRVVEVAVVANKKDPAKKPRSYINRFVCMASELDTSSDKGADDGDDIPF